MANDHLTSFVFLAAISACSGMISPRRKIAGAKQNIVVKWLPDIESRNRRYNRSIGRHNLVDRNSADPITCGEKTVHPVPNIGKR